MLDFHSGSTSPPTNLMSFLWFQRFNPHLYAKWGVIRYKVKLNKMLMAKGQLKYFPIDSPNLGYTFEA